jgi:hypothetical protein
VGKFVHLDPDPDSEPGSGYELTYLIESGSETLLPSLVFFLTLLVQDPNGATLALFNLYMHEPSEVSHQTVLQCVVYQVLKN